MPCGHIHRHTGAFFVIPACAGIQVVWPYSPSYRLPRPSYRRIIFVIPACAGIYGLCPYPPSSRRIFRHSGASRNLPAAIFRHSNFPVIPAPAGIYALRFSVIPIFPVIPAPAGIQGVCPYPPSSRLPRPSFRLDFSSFRRKPESMPAGSITVVADYDAGFRRKPQ